MDGINDSLHIATGALRTLSTGIAVSAHNVANISTAGFEPQRALYATGSGGRGVEVDAVLRDSMSLGGKAIQENADQYGDNEIHGFEPSGTDIAKEFALMIDTGHAFAANAQTVRTAEEMAGTISDIIA